MRPLALLALGALAACSGDSPPADGGLDAGPADAGMAVPHEIDCATPSIPDGGFAFTMGNSDDGGMPLATTAVTCRCLFGTDGGQGWLEVQLGGAGGAVSVSGLAANAIPVGEHHSSDRSSPVAVRGKVSSPGRFLYEASPGDAESDTTMWVERNDAQSVAATFNLEKLRVYEPAGDSFVAVSPPVHAVCRY